MKNDTTIQAILAGVRGAEIGGRAFEGGKTERDEVALVRAAEVNPSLSRYSIEYGAFFPDSLKHASVCVC